MKPLTHFVRRSCWGLAAALALQAPLAQAEMIGAEAAMAAQPATQEQLERARVQQFLESAALQDRLRALGVDGLHAASRVDAMTQQEVHALAQRIDSLPAGGAFSDREIILILLIALLIVVAL
ncbi:PA2779 family protein [Ramlibacter tataouinensis]|uniref:PA2779 family protein n=1 Tax=Ramlibacter tataouinensis TaxID=94132 RepID=UPI0022F3CB13|nr:PA2779 family protein [Ramlibacter tataouinensis]WBY00347.1 PA2779 family protein [Ramlibacter tataouinensis]